MPSKDRVKRKQTFVCILSKYLGQTIKDMKEDRQGLIGRKEGSRSVLAEDNMK
jgi:hypothetical protein